MPYENRKFPNPYFCDSEKWEWKSSVLTYLYINNNWDLVFIMGFIMNAIKKVFAIYEGSYSWILFENTQILVSYKSAQQRSFLFS